MGVGGGGSGQNSSGQLGGGAVRPVRSVWTLLPAQLLRCCVCCVGGRAQSEIRSCLRWASWRILISEAASQWFFFDQYEKSVRPLDGDQLASSKPPTWSWTQLKWPIVNPSNKYWFIISMLQVSLTWKSYAQFIRVLKVFFAFFVFIIIFY